MVAALQTLQVQLGVLQLGRHLLALLLQLLHGALHILAVGLKLGPLRHTQTQTHTHVSVAATFTFMWTPLDGGAASDGAFVLLYLPLQVPLGLLLRVQLVVKLLLQLLFDKVHLADGPVVLDPPFASWGGRGSDGDKSISAHQDDAAATLADCGSEDSETKDSHAGGGNTKKPLLVSQL